MSIFKNIFIISLTIYNILGHATNIRNKCVMPSTGSQSFKACKQIFLIFNIWRLDRGHRQELSLAASFKCMATKEPARTT